MSPAHPAIHRPVSTENLQLPCHGRYTRRARNAAFLSDLSFQGCRVCASDRRRRPQSGSRRSVLTVRYTRKLSAVSLAQATPGTVGNAGILYINVEGAREPFADMYNWAELKWWCDALNPNPNPNPDPGPSTPGSPPDFRLFHAPCAVVSGPSTVAPCLRFMGLVIRPSVVEPISNVYADENQSAVRTTLWFVCPATDQSPDPSRCFMCSTMMKPCVVTVLSRWRNPYTQHMLLQYFEPTGLVTQLPDAYNYKPYWCVETYPVSSHCRTGGGHACALHTQMHLRSFIMRTAAPSSCSLGLRSQNILCVACADHSGPPHTGACFAAASLLKR